MEVASEIEVCSTMKCCVFCGWLWRQKREKKSCRNQNRMHIKCRISFKFCPILLLPSLSSLLVDTFECIEGIMMALDGRTANEALIW